MIDVLIVGGGPAGLATAIGLALRGLGVVVYERARGAVDKACGEGVMPAGLARLQALGVLEHLDMSRTSPICGIRYLNESGTSAAARLPEKGLGIRRVALSQALRDRARHVGVELREGTSVDWDGAHVNGRPLLRADGEALAARFVVAADGLHSRLRARAGLDGTTDRGSQRFGLRRHVRVAPWTDHVEVYFSGEVEAYVTPVGAGEVGIAFLWDTVRSATRGAGTADFDAFLRTFPQLAVRVDGCEPTSESRGAGPMLHRSRAIVEPHFALVGDAAGYVDAITGEGISLALETSAVLVEELACKREGVMSAYAEAHRRALRAYARLALALLWVARRPGLRRSIVSALSYEPRVFELVLRRALTAGTGETKLRFLPSTMGGWDMPAETHVR